MYKTFLTHCVEWYPVTDEVKHALANIKERPKPRTDGLSTKERLQHKLQDRQKAKENEGPPRLALNDAQPKVMDMDDIDALAAFVAGDRELPAYPPTTSPN